MNYSKDGLRVSHHEQKYFCSFCNFKTHKKYNLEVHEKNKHGTLQTGSGALLKEQTIPHHVQQQSLHQRSIQSDSHIEKQSNQQEENIDQLHENIDKWQKAYETLKLQYQQEEKVTTSDDGRPSHVSIQLYDKCCKGLTDYMHYCKGLINLCQRVHTEKEQQLDRFCTAWEELKWERDTFANEINRRDCCGEGVIDEKFARKLRRKMLRDPNHYKN